MTDTAALPVAVADAALDDVDVAVDAIVLRGPGGALAVAGIATTIVVALYFAFYFLAYLPRGIVQ